MSTYDGSMIRVSRNRKECEASGDHFIERGDRYLDYRPGQRSRIAVCLKCATSTMFDCSLTGRTYLRYNCADVRALLESAHK